jgi:hypothetical protein
MEIKAETNRRDILWMNLHVFFRIPDNLAFIFFCSAGYFGAYLYGKGLSQGLVGLFLKAGEAIAVGLVVFLSLNALSVVFGLIAATRKSGILGDHLFRIEEEGIREITDANDTLTKWKSINSVRKSKRYILVQINWYLFHMIPHRAFKNQAEYDQFHNEISAKWKTAS